MGRLLEDLSNQIEQSREISEEFVWANCEENLDKELKRKVEDFLILNEAFLLQLANRLIDLSFITNSKFTEADKKSLEVEINHILESGPNSIRLINMFENFIRKRDNTNNKNNG